MKVCFAFQRSPISLFGWKFVLHSKDHPFWRSPISFFSWKFVLHSEDHPFLFHHGSFFCILSITFVFPFLPVMEVLFCILKTTQFFFPCKFVMNFTITRFFFSLFFLSSKMKFVLVGYLIWVVDWLIDCAIRCQHSFCGITNSSWILIFKHKFRLWAFHRQINRY